MMINKLIVFLVFAVVFAGCKKNSVQISGKLENPVKGTYLYLDELKANELSSVDSIKMGEDGKFNFRRPFRHFIC
jgi:hypothetical protein